jgi:group I intron endonuclease
LGGLFQTSQLFQIPTSILGSLSLIDELNLLLSLIPIVYSNAETDKSKIFTDTKGKTGIYQWTHKESGKVYIGSAFNLAERLGRYFSKNYIENAKGNSHIYNAILIHGYSAFSITILEYIDILDLSKENARKLILEREQYYLDLIFSVDQPNTYNILRAAGSLLGYQHDADSLAKMSGVNHPNYGKPLSSDTIAKISEAVSGEKNSQFGKTAENNSKFGKVHSPETRDKISKAQQGEKNSFFGKSHTAESKAKISKKVFVYSNANPTTLSHEFVSCSEAAIHFKCSIMTISRYLKSGKCFQDRWILSETRK